MEFIAGLIGAICVYLFLLRPIIQGFKEGSASKSVLRPSAAAANGAQRRSPSPDRDEWEGSFWDVPSPRVIKADLRLKYRDAAGSVTVRDVRLEKYGPWEGGALLWAFCHLRRAFRTFRSDRIVSCVDLETGEVIDDLEAWLDRKYQASPDRALELVIDRAWDAIRVLFYVSKADGRLTKKERAILRGAIRNLSEHPAIDDKRIDDLVDSLDIPTPTAFKQAFGRLVKQDRETAKRVADWSESLVATEKTIASGEQEAIEYMKDRLVRP